MSYKTYSLDELKQAVSKYTPVTILESASGAVVLTQYGARLLGLFPAATQKNTLWVNQSLDDVFAGESWRIGGERLWVAPERDFFYENPRDFDGFHVPAGIDPGNYTRAAETAFQNSFSLLNLATNDVFDNTLARRSFALVNDPYAANLAYAGVSITDSIEVQSEGARFCAWSLAQVYCGGPATIGTAFFPIKKGASVLSYFDPIPANRSDVRQGYARFKIDSAAIYKLAIAPEDILWDNPCKAVYVSPFPQGGQWFAVIKRTSDMPRSQGDCLDAAKRDPDSAKGAIQSYNNAPGPEDDSIFGEIELQLSAGVKHGKKTISKATHELLAYCGSKGEILELAKTALGAGETPAVY